VLVNENAFIDEITINLMARSPSSIAVLNELSGLDKNFIRMPISDEIKYGRKIQKLRHEYEAFEERGLNNKKDKKLYNIKKSEFQRLRNILVCHNTNLAVEPAMYFSKKNPTLDAEDIFSTSFDTLINASGLYDPDFEEGYRFSTYARRAIRNMLIRFVEKEYRRKKFITRSLDGHIYDGEVLKWMDITEDPNTDHISEKAAMREASDLIRLGIEDLADDEEYASKDQREKAYEVMRRRFRFEGELGFRKGATLEEVGNELNLTKERIRQIQNKSLEYLAENPYIKKADSILNLTK